MSGGFAHRVARDVLAVEGPDASEYLQGQLSQDVAALDEGQTAWSLLLEPDGKLGFWLRVHRRGPDSFLLDLDAPHGEAARARLERFRLRTRVEIEPLEWACVALRGPGVAEAAVAGADQVALPAPAGMQGVDLLGPGASIPEGIPAVDAAVFEAHRILAGVPAMGAELTEGLIPAEAGIVEDAVSFTKGCYTGQELVARIDSRGAATPRRLRLLRVAGPAPAGASVLAAGEAAGALTSTAPDPDGPGTVALGYLKRAVEPPAEVTVAWEDGEAPASAEALTSR